MNTIFCDYNGDKSFNQDLFKWNVSHGNGVQWMGDIFQTGAVFCEQCFNSKTNKIEHVQGFTQVHTALSV